MSPGWVGFFAGALVWGPMGLVVAAICVAGGRADMEMELAALRGENARLARGGVAKRMTGDLLTPAEPFEDFDQPLGIGADTHPDVYNL